MTEKWLKTAPPQSDSTKMNTQASEQTIKSAHFANFARIKRLEGSFGMKVNREQGNTTPETRMKKKVASSPVPKPKTCLLSPIQEEQTWGKNKIQSKKQFKNDLEKMGLRLHQPKTSLRKNAIRYKSPAKITENICIKPAGHISALRRSSKMRSARRQNSQSSDNSDQVALPNIGYKTKGGSRRQSIQKPPNAMQKKHKTSLFWTKKIKSEDVRYKPNHTHRRMIPKSRNDNVGGPRISVGTFNQYNTDFGSMATPVKTYRRKAMMNTLLTEDKEIKSEAEESLFNEKEEEVGRQKSLPKFYSSKTFAMKATDKTKAPFKNYLKTCTTKGIIPIMQHYDDSRKGKQHEIVMNNNSMGDHYAEAFAETLPFKNSKSSLNLSNNRLSQKGADSVIEKISKKIEVLDLSYNPSVKDLNVKILILDYKRRLRDLNIEGNNVGDSFVIKICKAVQERPVLESLNMSHNQITSKGALAIANLLQNNSTIIALFLRWNNIQSKGAAAICDALQSNHALKILELSFNPIGMGMKSGKRFERLTNVYGEEGEPDTPSNRNKNAGSEFQVCDNLKEMFIQNKALVHCDFSHCGLSTYECEVMNQGLKENHTILGLHMVGNKMNVDSLGFLKYDELLPSSSHVAPRLDNNLTTGTLPDSKLDLNASSNCWICEGWTQVKFKFDPYFSNNPPEHELTEKDRVFIHLSFDDYNPDAMTLGENEEFYITRMVPPMEFNYYFSINGVPKYATDLEKQEVFGEINLNIPYANIPAGITRTKELINKDYLSKLECYPRPKRENLIIYEEEIKAIPDWNIKDSVFWGYMIDTADMYHKCFEFDWNMCKIPKIIKDTKEQYEVKEYLKSIYKPIRETYKFYSGISPCGYVPGIGQNVFNEIINLTSIVDGKDIKLSDVDVEFISTKAGIKNQMLNPERWLVRYQLMEIFVRIALHKYYKPFKNTENKVTMTQAVKKLFEDHLLEHFKKHDCSKWRLEKLWTKENDEVFKNNFKYIRTLFGIYSGKHTKPGKTKFTSLDEFVTMISNANLLKSSTVGVGDIGSIFTVSMQSQVNDIEFEKHMQMSLIEFIEAIARVADRLVEIPDLDSFENTRKVSVDFSDEVSPVGQASEDPEDSVILSREVPAANMGKGTPTIKPKKFVLKSIAFLRLPEKIQQVLEVLIVSNFIKVKD